MAPTKKKSSSTKGRSKSKSVSKAKEEPKNFHITIDGFNYTPPNISTMNHAVSIIEEMSPRIWQTILSPLQVALESLNKVEATEDQSTKLLEIAMDKERNEDRSKSVNAVQFESYISTVPGVSHLVWILLRDQNKKLTEKQVLDYLSSLSGQALERVTQNFFALDDLPEPDVESYDLSVV